MEEAKELERREIISYFINIDISAVFWVTYEPVPSSKSSDEPASRASSYLRSVYKQLTGILRNLPAGYRSRLVKMPL